MIKFYYKIDVLAHLREAGYNTNQLRKLKLFSECTVQKFRELDTNINLATLARICELTGLEPSDIVEAVQVSEENQRRLEHEKHVKQAIYFMNKHKLEGEKEK